jgi:hypothetical protein
MGKTHLLPGLLTSVGIRPLPAWPSPPRSAEIASSDALIPHNKPEYTSVTFLLPGQSFLVGRPR